MTINHGDVVELVDTLVLGTSAVRREGSSPFIPTKEKEPALSGSFSLDELGGLNEYPHKLPVTICASTISKSVVTTRKQVLSSSFTTGV